MRKSAFSVRERCRFRQFALLRAAHLCFSILRWGDEVMIKIRSFFNTIRARILFITISLVVLISVIIAFASYFIVAENLQSKLIQTAETRLSFLSSSINSNINNVQSFIRSCQISDKVVDFALEGDTTDNRVKSEAHDFVMETYYSNAELTSHLVRLVVVGKDRPDIVQAVNTANSSIAVSKEAILSLSYFEQLHTNTNQASTDILPDPFFTTKYVSMIPFVHPVYHPYKADEIGYIFTEMSTAVITDPINNYISETDSRLFFRINDSLYEYHEDRLIRYEEAFRFIGDRSQYALSEDTSIEQVFLEDNQKQYLFITKPLGMDGWYVTECIDPGQTTQNLISTLFLIVLIILAATSLIGAFLFLFLYKTVSVPVAQLLLRISRIEQGDFSRDPSTEWDHELGSIGRAINNLSENVIHLMNQRIEDEKQKKDYEYRMLQSQINPHFLYNTLNSIKWMATIQNAPGIAEMTTSLSRLLKDISKGTSNLVSIRHELELLQDYFTIQKYRYGGTITMDIRVKEQELYGCEILKFTLQPLVENAIFHGIEPKGTAGKIQINLYTDSDKNIHIDVSDDGVGIDPGLADRLLGEESTASSSFFKELGISNVHKRLQYEFGTQYGLSIISEKGKFTTISILLPYRRSDENYD